MAHAQVIVEAWRREYNEERSKKSLGGLTPVADAHKLIQKPVKLTPDAKSPVLLKTGDVVGLITWNTWSKN